MISWFAVYLLQCFRAAGVLKFDIPHCRGAGSYDEFLVRHFQNYRVVAALRCGIVIYVWTCSTFFRALPYFVMFGALQ